MIRDILENGSIIDLIATFVALALIVAFVLSLVFIIVGGISFILSAGNEEKIKRSVHTIRYAIVGFIVTFLAFFIVAYLSKFLGIEFELSFSLIVSLMREIIASFQESL